MEHLDITTHDFEVFTKNVLSAYPELQTYVSTNGEWISDKKYRLRLNLDSAQKFADACKDVFLSKGLRSNSEPNEDGLTLDNLTFDFFSVKRKLRLKESMNVLS